MVTPSCFFRDAYRGGEEGNQDIYGNLQFHLWLWVHGRRHTSGGGGDKAAAGYLIMWFRGARMGGGGDNVVFEIHNPTFCFASMGFLSFFCLFSFYPSFFLFSLILSLFLFSRFFFLSLFFSLSLSLFMFISFFILSFFLTCFLSLFIYFLFFFFLVYLFSLWLPFFLILCITNDFPKSESLFLKFYYSIPVFIRYLSCFSPSSHFPIPNFFSWNIFS